MVKKKRFVYKVSLNADPVPGWNDTPEDVKRWLEKELERVSHYDPKVEILEEETDRPMVGWDHLDGKVLE